jgi:outer membrane beta-barrel protein
MQRASIALLVGLFVVNVFGHGSAAAQDMTFEEDGEVTATTTTTTTTTDAAPAAGGSEDFFATLAADSRPAQAAEEARASNRSEVREEIYAVQPIYALRLNRFELAPSAAFTMNDQYVTHTAASVGLNYWWTNVLAIGFNFLWYQGLENESDLNFFVRRSTRLAVPVTEYQLGAHLNFTYVPLYGKFSMFNEYIFQWDAYVIGGLGFMRTRPLSVVDPEVRTPNEAEFNFQFRVAFNVGVGIRVFLTRWLAVFGELRNYMYLERLENLDVAVGAARRDPSTWLDDNVSFTNNVTAHIGLSLFFPFTFEYQHPR